MLEPVYRLPTKETLSNQPKSYIKKIKFLNKKQTWKTRIKLKTNILSSKRQTRINRLSFQPT